MTPDPLGRLEAWYAGQCNGEWEHTHGVVVDTLDNPGWTVRIDLSDTTVADEAFECIEIRRSDDDWFVWRVDAKQFTIACGPRNLGEALTAVLTWTG